MQVYDDIDHEPEVCASDCKLQHCFCRVKLLAPCKTGNVAFELCIDLHPRLQAASFESLFDQTRDVPLEVRALARHDQLVHAILYLGEMAASCSACK